MNIEERINRVFAMFGLALGLSAPASFAQQNTLQIRDHVAAEQRLEAQRHVSGSQLMTERERAAYHKRMLNAESEQDRELIRIERHNALKERAKERGLTLPDSPPPSTGKSGRTGRGEEHPTSSRMRDGRGRALPNN